MVHINSKDVYTGERYYPVNKDIQNLCPIIVLFKCKLTGEYEPSFCVIYAVSTNKQNDLDVVEILPHGNAKPGNKRPQETLIKAGEFLTSPNNNISNIY